MSYFTVSKKFVALLALVIIYVVALHTSTQIMSWSTRTKPAPLQCLHYNLLPLPTARQFRKSLPLESCVDVNTWRRKALYCPFHGYQGLTNMLFALGQCVLISKYYGDFVPIVLDWRIHLGAWDDLFDVGSFVWFVRERYNVTVRFACERSETPPDVGLVRGERICNRRPSLVAIMQKERVYRVRDSLILFYFHDHAILPMIAFLATHLSPSVQRRVDAIQTGLGKNYVAVHARIERDSYLLTRKSPQQLGKEFASLLHDFAMHRLTPAERTSSCIYVTHVLGEHWPEKRLGMRLCTKGTFISMEGLTGETTHFPGGSDWGNETFKITNTTAALVEFAVLFHAHKVLVAGFSTFGASLGPIRCLRGEAYQLYGKNYRPFEFKCAEYRAAASCGTIHNEKNIQSPFFPEIT